MDATACSICLEDISNAHDSSTLQDSCTHSFHPHCIKQWALTFIQKKTWPKCPLCKSPFSTIIAFSGAKFIIDVVEDADDEEMQADEDESEEESDEADGSEFSGNDSDSEDEYIRCVICMAEVTPNTPNVNRCSSSRCSSLAHRHCVGADLVDWKCHPCYRRDETRRASEARRMQLNVLRERQAEQRRQQQQEMRERRTALRERRQSQSSRRTSPSTASPVVPSSVKMLHDQLILAQAASIAHLEDSYYCCTAEDLQLSFQQAKDTLARRSGRPHAGKGGSSDQATGNKGITCGLKRRVLASSLARDAYAALNSVAASSSIAIGGKPSTHKRPRRSNIGGTAPERDFDHIVSSWQHVPPSRPKMSREDVASAILKRL